MTRTPAQDRIRILQAFAAGGTDLTGLPAEDIRTAPEVTALLHALSALRDRITTDERLWTDRWNKPLSVLAREVQNFDHAALKQATGEVPDDLWECVNRLADVCETVTESLKAAPPGTTFGTEDSLALACKVIALYAHPRLPNFLRNVAPHPAFHDDYLWEVMFRACLQSTADEPDKLRALQGSLRHPLPTRFLLIAYLDFVNALGHNLGWYRTGQDHHPFDTTEGEAKLRELLENTDPEHASYAHSATATLLFLGPERRARLSTLAAAHPSKTVQLEVLHGQAAQGDEHAIRRMADLVNDDEVSERAYAYLKELGRLDAARSDSHSAPSAVRRDILAWLKHPNEFGRAPTRLDVQPPVRLYWPPTADTRELHVFRYAYDDTQPAREGQGLAGSILFALRSDTAHLTPQEVLALHCSWETAHHEGRDDWSVKDGMTRLAQRNADFRPNKGWLSRLFRA